MLFKNSFWLCLKSALLVALLVLVHSGMVHASTVRFLYPEDGVAVDTPALRIIGLVQEGYSGIITLQVENGGGLQSIPLTVIDGTVEKMITLAGGENQISFLDEHAKEIDRCLVTLLETGKAPPEGVRRYFVHHEKELTAICGDCHLATQASVSGYLYVEQKKSCSDASCHQVFVGKRFIHGALNDNQCIGCHNPHGSQEPYFLLQRGAKLCYRCHEKEKKHFSQGVRHNPVENGECLVCHEPHASDNPFHLKQGKTADLCASCHGYERVRRPFLHAPAGSGDCVACHNPHASPYPNLLYEKDDAMCRACHEGLENELPGKSNHPRLSAACVACHDPHGSQSAHLLRKGIGEDSSGKTRRSYSEKLD